MGCGSGAHGGLARNEVECESGVSGAEILCATGACEQRSFYWYKCLLSIRSGQTGLERVGR